MADLVVRELETNKEIHRVKLSSTGERYVERVMSGMLRNMDMDKYYIVEEKAE